MVEAFRDVPAGTKVPWYGPPMSPASFATDPLMDVLGARSVVG
jgi:hypothetical protein